MIHTSRIRRGVAALAAVGLVLAACGGDDDDDSSAPDDTEPASEETTAPETTEATTDTTEATTDTTAATDATTDTTEATTDTTEATSETVPFVECSSRGITDDTIRIGVQTSVTGRLQPTFGTMVPGMQARIDYQNEELGGFAGRQLELVVGDDGSDPTRGEQVARQLVEEQEVFGVIMAAVSDVAAGPYLEENNVPVAGYSATGSAWGTFTNFFGYWGGNDAELRSVSTPGLYMKDQGVTKLAAITFPLEASLKSGQQYVEGFEFVEGGETVLITDVPFANPDWSIQAQQLKEENVDGLYVPGSVDDVANAYTAALQAGVELKAVVFPSGYGPTTIEQLGDSVEGASFTSDFLPLDQQTPEQLALLDALETYGDDIKIVDGIVDYSIVSGWLQADLMIYGLGVAGDCPTGEEFITNLRQVTDYDGGGLLGREIDYTTAIGTPYFSCIYFSRIVDGQFVTSSELPLCGEELPE